VHNCHIHAKDRECSHPACTVPGYYSGVHHVTPYAKCGTTDVNHLTFGCGGHHPLAENGWVTRKNKAGDTEWIPFHHPEKLLRESDEDDEA
jgi:hypothetical protein